MPDSRRKMRRTISATPNHIQREGNECHRDIRAAGQRKAPEISQKFPGGNRGPAQLLIQEVVDHVCVQFNARISDAAVMEGCEGRAMPVAVAPTITILSAKVPGAELFCDDIGDGIVRESFARATVIDE